MVVDSLENAKKYYALHKDFKEVFEYIEKIGEETVPGKYIIRAGEIWVIVSHMQEVADIKERMYEAHEKYADIHYILHGEEEFGYSNIERLMVTQSYNAEEDYKFLSGKFQSFHMKKGDFCILFPEDAHIPYAAKMGTDVLKRVMVKIRID